MCTCTFIAMAFHCLVLQYLGKEFQVLNLYILFSSFFLILFLLIFLPLLVLVLVPLLVSQIESRVHGGSLLSAPVLRIQISRQRGVCIKPILTNCRLLHFSLKPSPEVGDPGKHGSDVSLKSQG